MIRHSYISSLDQNVLTTREKEEIAAEMAHSRGMQELYRFVDKGGNNQATENNNNDTYNDNKN